MKRFHTYFYLITFVVTGFLLSTDSQAQKTDTSSIYTAKSFKVRSHALNVIKPKKITLVKSFDVYSSREVADYIRKNMRNGFNVTHVAGANYSQSKSTWIVIMEKNQ